MTFQEILDLNIFKISNFSFKVFDLILLFVLLISAWAALRVFRAVLGRFVKKGRLDARNKTSFYLLAKYLVWIVSLLLALEIIGFKITLLLAGSAALLVGLGLGLQQIFSDIVSGIFLLVEGSVKIGDIMEVDGLVGKVTEINLRTSDIQTRDGIVIIVPNHKFITENVVNWSHNASTTRFQVDIGVAYGTDPEKMKAILSECAKEHPDVYSQEPYTPIVRLVNFGESSLDFRLLFWSNNAFFIENTKSDLRFLIVKKLAENKIEIPFPQRDIHIKNNSK